MAKTGKGAKATNVSFGLALNIKKMLKPNTAARFIKYMIAGPVYMRTLLTSSAMRFIKSPVLCVL